MTSTPNSSSSSPAPIVRPPISSPANAKRARPGLGLALSIPGSSPSPASSNASLEPPLIIPSSRSDAGRPGPPRLQINTPLGSTGPAPSDVTADHRAGLRTGPYLSTSNSGPSSAVSHSALPYVEFFPHGGSSTKSNNNTNSSSPGDVSANSLDHDFITSRSDDGVSSVATSAANSLHEGLSGHGPAPGYPLDAEDLTNDGWLAASKEGRIVELGSLGEGAGGAVTRCKLKGGTTTFALKVITTDPNPDVRKQILRELNFNQSCDSPYICRYYGAFLDLTSGTISIAMEFCEGGSLDSVYREVKKRGGRTGEKPLGKIAEGVLSGLTYLHGKRIIHRDIKPSNILLTRQGGVKLCDFGVSGELIGSKGDANTFIGTSYYMAPERIQGKSYTITSDVWSLGVTLLEVAQHRFPFGGSDDDDGEGGGRAALIDLLTWIVSKPMPVLKDEPEKGVRWSESFKYFIACCLEKDTARRASPWRMLEHPWMVEMKAKKVNVASFLAQVWDWKD